MHDALARMRLNAGEPAVDPAAQPVIHGGRSLPIAAIPGYEPPDWRAIVEQEKAEEAAQRARQATADAQAEHEPEPPPRPRKWGPFR